jgi:SAM-dependent methyltransferase
VSFDATYFVELQEIEDHHFWFRARNRLIRAVVERFAPPPGSRGWALEIGCGTGNVLRVLEQAWAPGRVVGLDLWPEALLHARRRTKAFLVCGDVNRLPLRGEFSLVGAFDVIEHVPDDEGLLRHLWRGLVPGGLACLTVPAFPSLWSYFDDEARHCRRYREAGLRAVLEKSGFEVVHSTHFMATLVPLVWLHRRAPAAPAGSGPAGEERPRDRVQRELRLSRFANRALEAALAPELALLTRGASLPFGSSLIVLARKPRD